jgi:hypothetical protein
MRKRPPFCGSDRHLQKTRLTLQASLTMLMALVCTFGFDIVVEYIAKSFSKFDDFDVYYFDLFVLLLCFSFSCEVCKTLN